MPSAKILIVDDDRYFARHYIQQFKNYFIVTACYDAEHAVQLLSQPNEFIAAIIDVMMPAPKGKEDECHHGNSTGIWIIQECRNAIIAAHLPIIILTYSALSSVQFDVKFLDFPSKLVEVRSKSILCVQDLSLVSV